METIISIDGANVLCALKGRLDTLASQQVSKDIQPVLEHAGGTVTLDCSDLEYISSSGLRIFLTIRKEASRQGGKVIVRNLRKEIGQVFLMTGFYNLFEMQQA